MDTAGAVGTPLLVVEVVSPTGRRRDLVEKRAHYEQAGVPSYWLVDSVRQTFTALGLREGVYGERARLVGPGEVVLTEPFSVTLRPFG